MAKSEKKKYTKKNIANKIHKSKKNSGTAKKKAFRKTFSYFQGNITLHLEKSLR